MAERARGRDRREVPTAPPDDLRRSAGLRTGRGQPVALPRTTREECHRPFRIAEACGRGGTAATGGARGRRGEPVPVGLPGAEPATEREGIGAPARLRLLAGAPKVATCAEWERR